MMIDSKRATAQTWKAAAERGFTVEPGTVGDRYGNLRKRFVLHQNGHRIGDSDGYSSKKQAAAILNNFFSRRRPPYPQEPQCKAPATPTTPR